MTDNLKSKIENLKSEDFAKRSGGIGKVIK